MGLLNFWDTITIDWRPLGHWSSFFFCNKHEFYSIFELLGFIVHSTAITIMWPSLAKVFLACQSFYHILNVCVCVCFGTSTQFVHAEWLIQIQQRRQKKKFCPIFMPHKSDSPNLCRMPFHSAWSNLFSTSPKWRTCTGVKLYCTRHITKSLEGRIH